jgi:ketosteroid isomerase-like protein
MATLASVQAAALRRLLDAAVTGDRAAMADLVTDDVVAWSPNLIVMSRQDLLDALEPADGSLSEIDVEVHGVDQIGDKAVAEWHLAATHSGPLVIDDDTVVAPTGRRLHLSGATIAEFSGDHICAFRSYFDDLALLEQALAGS